MFVEEDITILFSGDSGDGIQILGDEFTKNTAFFGNDFRTLPDFPSEIRAPQNTIAGVSGFQIQLGGEALYTPGDIFDVLVCMNAASYIKNLSRLKPNGILILNKGGFEQRMIEEVNLTTNPLESIEIKNKYQLLVLDVALHLSQILADSPLNGKEKDKTKNFFILGYLYWMFHRSPENTLNFIEKKFPPTLALANSQVLKAGYYFGDTVEQAPKFAIKKYEKEKGLYRNIKGNEALSIGLVVGAYKSQLALFFSGYPITPASDILHFLSSYQKWGVQVFQAEDEIAAIGAIIGASIGGKLGVTASSGPGIALKTEGLGLACMLEIPLIVINVQRGGPSTGMPTKTEQADLLQAVYGRNGEAPIPVIAPCTPSDCFDMAIMATKIAVEFMTPVFILSDSYIANGALPWKIPKIEEIPPINPKYNNNPNNYQPYERDANLVRAWGIPGKEWDICRIGGLEKEDGSGKVSDDPENHQKMVKLRAKKIKNIQSIIPNQEVLLSIGKTNTAVVSWGSTYGATRTAVSQAHSQNIAVDFIIITYLNPFPKNLKILLNKYDTLIVPELNNGQLKVLLQNIYKKKIMSILKIKGIPFEANEILQFIKKSLTIK